MQSYAARYANAEFARDLPPARRGRIARTLLLLLGVPDSLELLLAAALVCLSTSLGIQEVVPPAEAGGVVANELLVVHVVVVSAGPNWEEVSQAPREVVATVGINGLEEAQDDPDVHGDQVEIASDTEQQDR